MTANSITPVVIAAVLGVTSPPLWAQDPTKPCTLLTSAEAKAFSGAQVGEGATHFLAPTGTYSCMYQWRARDFSPSLEVTVSDASKVYPGKGSDSIKMGITGGPRGLPPNFTLVTGVGEAANFMSDSPTAAFAMAYMKGKILTVGYRGTDARAKKDQVIGLLKTAASRLK